MCSALKGQSQVFTAFRTFRFRPRDRQTGLFLAIKCHIVFSGLNTWIRVKKKTPKTMALQTIALQSIGVYGKNQV